MQRKRNQRENRQTELHQSLKVLFIKGICEENENKIENVKVYS
jgi:hypothetical protein